MPKIVDDGFARHVMKDGVTHSFLPGDDVPGWAVELIDERHFASASSDVPARSGAGSGRTKWADYAASNGVDVQESHTRDDIVAACEAAGVSVD